MLNSVASDFAIREGLAQSFRQCLFFKVAPGSGSGGHEEDTPAAVPPAAAEVAEPPPVAMDGEIGFERTFTWRTFKFTAIYKKTPDGGRAHSGWEATCYKHEGKPACRLTRSFGKHYTQEQVLRVLKYWCLRWRHGANKHLHVHYVADPPLAELPLSDALEHMPELLPL